MPMAQNMKIGGEAIRARSVHAFVETLIGAGRSPRVPAHRAFTMFSSWRFDTVDNMWKTLAFTTVPS